ncbi:MAG: MFS transporter [Flavobacteriaceae bacterium]|nr:MFS transporter [Flavobacteriaceae bacterium]
MTQTQSQSRYPQLVLLVMIVFFVISFITNILNSIIVAVKDSFELSLSAAGFLPFSFFIAYAVMSIPAGFLAERYSSRSLLTGSFGVIVISCLTFVLNPSYLYFLGTLFVLGLCMAVLQVIINPMLRFAGGEEHFAFNSVLAQVVFGGASFLSPWLYMELVKDQTYQFISSVFPGWIPENLPWLSLYVFFALLALVILGVIRMIPFPKVEKSDQEQVGAISAYKELLLNRWAYLFFLGIFAYVGFEQGVGNWMAEYLRTHHHYTEDYIGSATVSYFWAMLTVGSLIGLLLLKLFDSKKVLLMSSFATIILLLSALYGPAKWALVGFPAIGFSISVMWSIIFSLGLNSVKHHHGALSGILCTGIAGGAIWPLIVGFLGDWLSLQFAMTVLILPLVYIMSIGIWAKPLIRNKTLR